MFASSRVLHTFYIPLLRWSQGILTFLAALQMILTSEWIIAGTLESY